MLSIDTAALPRGGSTGRTYSPDSSHWFGFSMSKGDCTEGRGGPRRMTIRSWPPLKVVKFYCVLTDFAGFKKVICSSRFYPCPPFKTFCPDVPRKGLIELRLNITKIGCARLTGPGACSDAVTTPLNSQHHATVLLREVNSWCNEHDEQFRFQKVNSVCGFFRCLMAHWCMRETMFCEFSRKTFWKTPFDSNICEGVLHPIYGKSLEW